MLPEGHVESEHKKDDIAHLKQKVDCGVDFLTTQMFFDNNILYNFLYRARENGCYRSGYSGNHAGNKCKSGKENPVYGPEPTFRRDSKQS